MFKEILKYNQGIYVFLIHNIYAQNLVFSSLPDYNYFLERKVRASPYILQWKWHFSALFIVFFNLIKILI